MVEPSERRALTPGEGILCGACVPLGWGLHDVFLFATSDRPAAALGLVPGLARAVLVGALVGYVLARWRGSLVPLALLLAAAAVRPARFGLDASRAARWLPVSVLLALALWLVACEAHRRTRARIVPLALGLGVLTAGVAGWLRTGPGFVMIAPALASLVAVPLAWGRPAAWRRAAFAACALVPAVLLARGALARTRLPRPDLGPPSAVAPPGAHGVLLVVLDTVRLDHLSVYGYERDTTPALAAFARADATLYDEARSTSPWTLPSHASLFTGLLPGEHGVRNLHAPPGAAERLFRPPPLATDLPTLASRLRGAGWRTGAIVANNMLDHVTGLDRGFERYDDRKSAHVRTYLAFGQVGGGRELLGRRPYRDARVVTDLALTWLDRERGGAPFFLFLNYMDAHAPYFPPPPFDRRFAQGRPVDRRARADWPLLYDRELAFLDAELGRLFEGLKERGLYEDTLVVVTADHGESFGDHGSWAHGWTLYDELIHVPLLVKPPGARRAAVDHEELDGADLPGLVLRELGLPDEERAPRPVDAEWYATRAHFGQAFLDPSVEHAEEKRGDLVSWIEHGVKTIVASSGGVEAFDLATDPHEERPLPLSAEMQAAARARAAAWWSAHPPPERSGEQAGGRDLENLQELGYAAAGR